MLLMNALQVIKRNSVFALSGSLLDAFFANFRSTLNVDDTSEVDNFVHGYQMVVELQVYCMLSLVEDVHIAHDGCKDETIGEQRSLRDASAPASHFAVLRPLVQPAHEGVDLEGEAPSFWLIVVEPKQVDVAILSYLLPLGQWFIQYGQLGEGLADELQDGRFATSYVAFDGNESWLSVGHFGGTDDDQINYKIMQYRHYLNLSDLYRSRRVNRK